MSFCSEKGVFSFLYSDGECGVTNGEINYIWLYHMESWIFQNYFFWHMHLCILQDAPGAYALHEIQKERNFIVLSPGV